MRKKQLLITALAIFVVTACYFRYGNLFTLENLQVRRGNLAMIIAERPVISSIGFFFLYIFVTALSIPGAAVLTIAAGALFGIWWGLLLVSFASAIGATLACAAARWLLRDYVISRFPQQSARISDGFQKDGILYLFSLRLIPLFPFFLVNLAMGLTKMPLRSFYWVSQLAMFPATLVFVNAGLQLARIEAINDVLTADLLLAFFLLGALPWIGRLLASLLKSIKKWRAHD